MTRKLEEIKQNLEKAIVTLIQGSVAHDYATYCLRLVAALEKCKKQRNDYHKRTFFQFDSNMLNAEIYGKQIEVDDQQLTKILEGKDG